MESTPGRPRVRVTRPARSFFHGSTHYGHALRPDTAGRWHDLLLLLALSSLRFSLMAKATGDFPAFPGERPTMGQMKEWLESARDQLSADQRALVDGYDPRGVAALEPDSVPPALVASDSTGVTAPMVATRDVVRMQLQDKNVKLASQKRTLLAELKNEFFQALCRACRPSAPLLVQRMERDHRLADFAKYHDGGLFWTHLVTMGEVARMLPGEDETHDEELQKMVKSPLPDGASAQQYADRVNSALHDHIPYISRPFGSQAQLSEWIMNRVPTGNTLEAPSLKTGFLMNTPWMYWTSSGACLRTTGSVAGAAGCAARPRGRTR